MQRGASLAIQERSVIDNKQGEWESLAAVYYRGDLGESVQQQVFRFKGGEDIKIICDPFHSASSSPPPEKIKATDAYDFFELGKVRTGDAEFSMDMTHHGNQSATLHLTMGWWPPGSKDRDALYVGKLSLPLRWDRGSYAVLVTDVVEKIVWGLPLQAFSEISMEGMKRLVPTRGLKAARRGGRKSLPGRGGHACGPRATPHGPSQGSQIVSLMPNMSGQGGDFGPSRGISSE